MIHRCALGLACTALLLASAPTAAGRGIVVGSKNFTESVVLGELGMGELLRELRTRWIAPLMAREFAEVGGDDTDGEHGFLAEYGRDHDN